MKKFDAEKYMENIHKSVEEEKNRVEFERDILWGYLEDFKTIVESLEDHYGKSSLETKKGRLRIARGIKKRLETLLADYYPRYEDEK